mmetsp:Transcript_10492/g.34763  ORF Transcript_10492/g.34763 Transcript_10492/m.34763 type:complete len:208 (+) Transcript_10492:347-970(+)
MRGLGLPAGPLTFFGPLKGRSGAKSRRPSKFALASADAWFVAPPFWSAEMTTASASRSSLASSSAASHSKYSSQTWSATDDSARTDRRRVFFVTFFTARSERRFASKSRPFQSTVAASSGGASSSAGASSSVTEDQRRFCRRRDNATRLRRRGAAASAECLCSGLRSGLAPPVRSSAAPDRSRSMRRKMTIEGGGGRRSRAAGAARS